MSLHDIAKHVESQGRGEDTVLVHMTPHEVGGLQALAKAHGGSLTRNPQTGLYEAGFLSSILPMVAGVATAAFAPELLPLVAGGIGVADYAMTGSISQGLMAGLGAWSGGSLASGLNAAGESAIATAGGDTANAAFDASQAKALEAAGGDQINQTALKDIAQNQIQSMPNLTPDQVSNMTGQGLTDANAAQVVRGAGAANAAMGATPAAGMMAGISSPSAIGSAISSNPGAAAGVAGSLLLGNGNLFKPTSAAVPANTTVSQPLARLSPNYKPNVVTTPTTHYQASYPNYAANPYNPYATTGTQYPQAVTAADGGLMQGGPAKVNFMGEDMYPQSQIQRSYYATPTQMPTSAQQTAASYEPKTNPLTGELTQSMAAGGIASLAGGGNTQVAVPAESTAANQNAIKALQTMMANSANAPTQTQAQPAATTGYGAPSFTRTPVGTAGQAIDATQMQGSPAYIKAQADAAAQNWANFQAYQNANASGGGGGDGGGDGGGGGGGDGGDAKGGYFHKNQFNYHNLASGGILAFAQGGQKPAGNKDMAAIDDYAAQAQSGGIASVKDAAQNGDWNAMIALQKLGYQQGKDFAVGGGISDLGSYSDGGRLLKGPGDGVSDNIPAQIGEHQPARLADGEFVVPARIVSELGNGSTDAGAKRLYAMMDRVQAKRKKSMGKGKFAVNSKAGKDLPV